LFSSLLTLLFLFLFFFFFFLFFLDESNTVETSLGTSMNKEAVAKIRDSWIHQQLRSRGKEFTRYTDADVLCATWNVNAKKVRFNRFSSSFE
jgi:hypothetical protein